MNRSPGPEEFTNMDDQLTAIIMELRRHFESFYGERLVQMLLFGSQARGDAEPESDIDVLVVLQGPVDPGAEIARTGEVTALLALKHNMWSSLVCSYLPNSTPRNRVPSC
jgi:predicted nucleotidyltransferase